MRATIEVHPFLSDEIHQLLERKVAQDARYDGGAPLSF